MTSSVSVIIPLHNGAATIVETLDALTRQQIQLEVIVVDDRSTDAGPELARSHRVGAQVIASTGPGPSAARNTGLQRAHHDVIVFVDADDILLPGALAARCARAQSDGILLVCGYELLWPSGVRTAPAHRAREGADALLGLVRGNLGPPVAWTFRRGPLLTAGGFRNDLDHFEDWELALRMAFGGSSLVVDPVVDCLYRQRAGMAMTQPAAPAAALTVLHALAPAVARHRDAPRLERARRRAMFEAWLWRGAIDARRGAPAEALVDAWQAVQSAPREAPTLPFFLARRWWNRRRRSGHLAGGS